MQTLKQQYCKWKSFLNKAMTEYHANDPKIRAAMVEYEDGGFLALELS